MSIGGSLIHLGYNLQQTKVVQVKRQWGFAAEALKGIWLDKDSNLSVSPPFRDPPE